MATAGCSEPGSRSPSGRLVAHEQVEGDAPLLARDLLARRTGLSRRMVKLAMQRGAVWVRRGGPRRRLRRATSQVQPGDTVELFFDPALMEGEAPVAELRLDLRRYAVWFKPAGLLTQGTLYGDHFSLQRQVERSLGARRRVHLVHRLDRETGGLLLLAYGRDAAARLSALLRQGEVDKRYRALVLGELERTLGARGELDQPVDGKPARTGFRVLEQQQRERREVTLVELQLYSGRTHQIRRQLAGCGHPVLGDPRYGSGNKNRSGLCLVAYSLAWRCPFSRRELRVALSAEELAALL